MARSVLRSAMPRCARVKSVSGATQVMVRVQVGERRQVVKTEGLSINFIDPKAYATRYCVQLRTDHTFNDKHHRQTGQNKQDAGCKPTQSFHVGRMRPTHCSYSGQTTQGSTGANQNNKVQTQNREQVKRKLIGCGLVVGSAQMSKPEAAGLLAAAAAALGCAS